MARDNTSYDGIKDRHRCQQGTAPRGERAGARKRREREIWAEENEKKDWKPGALDRSKQRANIPLGRNHEQPARHKGDQTTDRNLETGKADPNLASHEGATGAVEPKKNHSQQNTEADEEAKGRTPDDH